MKISGRDVRIFMLGFITFFILESIYNWESSIKAFERGWNHAPGEKSK